MNEELIGIPNNLSHTYQDCLIRKGRLGTPRQFISPGNHSLRTKPLRAASAFSKTQSFDCVEIEGQRETIILILYYKPTLTFLAALQAKTMAERIKEESWLGVLVLDVIELSSMVIILNKPKDLNTIYNYIIQHEIANGNNQYKKS